MGVSWMMPAVQKRKSARRGIYLGAAVVILAAGGLGLAIHADAPLTEADYQRDPARMIEAYRHVEAASVSDAEEQLLHEKHYMSHRMQAVFPTKFAGTALTVLLKKEENKDPDALTGMLAPSTAVAPGRSTS